MVRTHATMRVLSGWCVLNGGATSWSFVVQSECVHDVHGGDVCSDLRFTVHPVRLKVDVGVHHVHIHLVFLSCSHVEIWYAGEESKQRTPTEGDPSAHTHAHTTWTCHTVPAETL